MKNKFLKNSSILIIGEVLTKLLGILYIIPLYHINPKIGGIIANLFIPYGFILIFAAIGINNVMTNEISKYHKKDESQFRNVLNNGFIFSFAMGILLFIIMYVLAPILVQHLTVPNSDFYQSQLIKGTRILSVGVILFAITNYMRAVMMGLGEYKIVSISYFLEQVIKVSIIIFMSYSLLVVKDMNLYSVIPALSYAVIISIMGSLILFSYKFYKFDLFRYYFKGFKFEFNEMQFMLTSGLIFFVNGLFITLFDQFDIFLMIPLFTRAGISIDNMDLIKSIYFTYSFKMILIPISLATAFFSTMIQQFNSKNDNKDEIIKRIFKTVFVYSILSMSFMIIFADIIYTIMYSASTLGTSLMRLQAILIPLYIMRSMISLYLILLNEKKLVLYNNFLLLGLKLSLNIVIIYVYPSIYSFIYTGILALIISTSILIKKSNIQIEYKYYTKAIIKIVVLVVLGLLLYGFINPYIFIIKIIIISLFYIVIGLVLFKKEILNIIHFR